MCVLEEKWYHKEQCGQVTLRNGTDLDISLDLRLCLRSLRLGLGSFVMDKHLMMTTATMTYIHATIMHRNEKLWTRADQQSITSDQANYSPVASP